MSNAVRLVSGTNPDQEITEYTDGLFALVSILLRVRREVDLWFDSWSLSSILIAWHFCRVCGGRFLPAGFREVTGL